MRYVGDLITESRRDTNNVDFGADSGIDTEDFLRYMNYAQERLQGIILATNPASFQSEKEISLVANQQAYSIPDRVYLGERIVNVEYSPTGQTRDYYKISERALSYRSSYPEQYPIAYVRRSGQILLTPTPSLSQGKIRVTYERQLDTLSLRRGTMVTVGKNIGNTELIILTLDTASDDPTAISGATDKYLCANDKYGNVTMYNIDYTSYDSGTGSVSITGGGFVFASGETIVVGNFVTTGQYTTTHSKLKDPCERYLQAYCNWKIFGRDAATQGKAKIFEDEVGMMEDEIKRSYQEADKDEDDIQISNSDLMLTECG